MSIPRCSQSFQKLKLSPNKYSFSLPTLLGYALMLGLVALVLSVWFNSSALADLVLTGPSSCAPGTNIQLNSQFPESPFSECTVEITNSAGNLIYSGIRFTDDPFNLWVPADGSVPLITITMSLFSDPSIFSSLVVKVGSSPYNSGIIRHHRHDQAHDQETIEQLQNTSLLTINALASATDQFKKSYRIKAARKCPQMK